MIVFTECYYNYNKKLLFNVPYILMCTCDIVDFVLLFRYLV